MNYIEKLSDCEKNLIRDNIMKKLDKNNLNDEKKELKKVLVAAAKA